MRVSAKECHILHRVQDPRQSEESISPEESPAYCTGAYKGKGDRDAGTCSWYGVSEPVCIKDGICETGIEFPNPCGIRSASKLGGEAEGMGDCLHEED